MNMKSIDRTVQDVRYGLRLLRRHPLLSAAVILTLALGIGLDAGAFTLIDGMLFRARVNESPSTFVQLDPQFTGAGAGLPIVSVGDYAAYRDQARSLRALAAWAPVHATLAGSAASGSQGYVALLVTCNFFSVYPAVPIAGRVFRADECAAPGASNVVVIAEELWRARFASDPRIVGANIDLDGHPFTVVGVMPSSYDGRLRGPIWIPYTMEAAFFAGRDLFQEPLVSWLVMVGRLHPGVSRAAAAAELQVIARERDGLVPGRKSTMRLTGGSMFEMMRSPAVAISIVPLVMGALSLVLLIACANVTMLLLSRAAARQHEMAVRLSLGASSGQLIRMLLTEGLLLAIIAGPASAWIAYEVPIAWKARIPQLPFYPFQFDLWTFAYMAAVTFAAGALATLAPAMEALKSSTSGSLQGQGAFGSGKWRTANLLIVAEVAMSLVLLVGAGLLLHGEYALRTADPGFDSAHVLLATPRISIPPHTRTSAAGFYARLSRAIGQLPGVRTVAFASAPPLGAPEGGAETVTLRRSGAADYTAPINAVTERYFETMNISIVRGRAFVDDDAVSRVRPIVVSEALSRTLWPDEDPLGQVLEDSHGRPLEVVGVARTIETALADSSAGALVYAPREADAFGDALLVRVGGDAAPVARAIRETIRSLDVNATAEAQTLASIRIDVADRFMRIVGVVVWLGVVAIGLAVVGLYGVTTFTASQRTKEMGIRMALGATRRDIIALVLTSGAKSTAIGVGIGLMIATIASRALQQVFAHAPLDVRSPATFAAASALLAIIVVAAMIGPARRAASADPIHALRRD
jgi:predicted permease